VTRSAPENCVFHDDALSSDGNGPTLSDDLRTVHDAATWTDCDVAAHNCIWCYPSRRIDLRQNAVMFEEQAVLLEGFESASRNVGSKTCSINWLLLDILDIISS